jgi:hypothetical protein
VIQFEMNVVGVALVTIISEAISAIDMARIGIPAGIQSCLFNFANVSI